MLCGPWPEAGRDVNGHELPAFAVGENWWFARRLVLFSNAQHMVGPHFDDGFSASWRVIASHGTWVGVYGEGNGSDHSATALAARRWEL